MRLYWHEGADSMRKKAESRCATLLVPPRALYISTVWPIHKADIPLELDMEELKEKTGCKYS